MTTTTAAWFEQASNKAIASIIGSPVFLGQQLGRVGSAVPNGGTVKHINTVRDTFIVESELCGRPFVTEVRFSAYRHALKCASAPWSLDKR